MEFIGWMYDIAREQSPRAKTLRAVLQRSRESGYNAVGFYLEHRFRYDSAPWAADTGCLTPELVRELCDDLKPAGLRIIPFLNTLGHMEGFVRTVEGRPLAEGSRNGTEQICPLNPQTPAFVRGLVQDALSAFDDDWVHLGGDEPWQLGTCARCAAFAKAHGKAALYGQYYRELCKFVLERGKRPALWADMLNEYPAALDLLPRETILFDWHYDGGPEETTRRLRARGFDVVCCPAVHTYDASWCFLDQTCRGIAEHALAAAATGALGVLVTTWELAYFTHYPTIVPLICAAGEFLSRGMSWPDALEHCGGPDYARAADILGNQIPATSAFLAPGTWRLLRDRLIVRQNPFELWRDWRGEACGDVGGRILALCDQAARALPETHALQWPIALHRIAVEFVNRVEFAAREYENANLADCVSHLENAARVLRSLLRIALAAEIAGGSYVDRKRVNVLLGKVDRAIQRVVRAEERRRNADGRCVRPAFETLVSDGWIERDQAAWKTGTTP